jgi:hypothetical protein
MKKLLAILLSVTMVSCSTSKRNLLGYWYQPKTMINVRFNADRSFEYNDHDSAANKPRKLSGRYSLNDNKVLLEFADNTKQTFSFDKANPGGNYYLKRDDAYFIKDTRVNNAVPPDTLQKK